jgi:hypothetical protein
MKDVEQHWEAVTALNIRNSTNIHVENNNFFDSYTMRQNGISRWVTLISFSSSVSFIGNTFRGNTAPHMFQANMLSQSAPNTFIFSENTIEHNVIYNGNIHIFGDVNTNIEVVKNKILNNDARSFWNSGGWIGMDVRGYNVLVHDNLIAHNTRTTSASNGLDVGGRYTVGSAFQPPSMLTVTDNIILNNDFGSGYGMAIYPSNVYPSEANISDNQLFHNTANRVVDIRSLGIVNFSFNEIANNEASRSIQIGGIYQDSSISIINCTIAYNT